jgi:N utilization substance protein B
VSLFGAESPRQVDTLVQNHRHGQIRAVKQLESANPQYDPLHQVHVSQGSVEEGLQFVVQTVLSGNDAAQQHFEMRLVHPGHVLRSPELPVAVVLDECIDLARRFGSEQGHSFVNAVLDKAARQWRGGEAGTG